MLLSAVSVLVVAQSSWEIPEGLMNNPVHLLTLVRTWILLRCIPNIMYVLNTAFAHVHSWTVTSLPDNSRVHSEMRFDVKLLDLGIVTCAL